MKFLLLFVKFVFMCLFIRTDVHSVKLEHKISRNRLISGLYGSSSISLQRDMEGDDMNVVQKEKDTIINEILEKILPVSFLARDTKKLRTHRETSPSLAHTFPIKNSLATAMTYHQKKSQLPTKLVIKSPSTLKRIQRAMETALKQEAGKHHFLNATEEIDTAMHSKEYSKAKSQLADVFKNADKMAADQMEKIKNKLEKDHFGSHNSDNSSKYNPYAEIRFAQSASKTRSKQEGTGRGKLGDGMRHKPFPFGGRGYKYSPSQYKHPPTDPRNLI